MIFDVLSFNIKSFSSIGWRAGIILAVVFTCFLAVPSRAQQGDPAEPAVVVQPGAPGQPTRILPPTTRAILPPRSLKDVEFMQGMIIHHAQAVEMTEMIEARTGNKGVRLLGARISQSQADEMKFMQGWLETRGEPLVMAMSGTRSGHSHGGHSSSHLLMPGMLSSRQML